MSFELSPKSWERIHAFQRNEMIALASNGAHAREMSHLAYYSRIGVALGPNPGKALEIGCGPGRYVAILASLGWDVVGADPHSYPSWELISKYREVTWADGVHAEKLPYATASFDAVACLGALLYFQDAKAAMSEIFRVLKPGGRLVMRTVNRNNLFRKLRGVNVDPATVNLYTEAELADFLNQSGFHVSSTFSYGFYPPILPGPWWYLVNGTLSLRFQDLLSSVTPSSYRVNVVAFAERR